LEEALDQAWLPNLPDVARQPSGVWPAQALERGIESGVIAAAAGVAPEQVQPASLDLRLDDHLFAVSASFLPGPRRTVAARLADLGAERIDIAEGAVLRRDRVYLAPLQESLSLRRRVSALANPKSSIGRLDVFCRVITDYGTTFDRVPERYQGPLWLEIAPRSFHVRVQKGSRLVQLRLKTGSPPGGEKFHRELSETVRLPRYPDEIEVVRDGGINLSVDLLGHDESPVVGYRARRVDAVIDIERIGAYPVADFWEPIPKPATGTLVLSQDEFHILATSEKVSVPPHLAADMVAYDTVVGEFRAHYAGFFDPGFGYGAQGSPGAPIVLEMRSHEVPFMLEHGQIVGRMLVERLTEPTERPYGAGIGSNYAGQRLTLAKQFVR